MKSKHRMFDCPELQKDPARLKRLKDAYLSKCVPVAHDSEQSADQMHIQVPEQPCNALVMDAERQKGRPRPTDQLALN